MRYLICLIVVELCCVCLLIADDDHCAGETLQTQLADRAFDAVTGRDSRQFPPDAQVDFQHIKLDIRMPDPMSKSFSCDETIKFTTAQGSVARLELDAVNLKIGSVTDSVGKKLDFRHDERRLTVRFEPALKPASTHEILIKYECKDPREGMYFALPDAGYPDRPLQIHTQGQPETNRYWFVSHDYPNDRQSTEILVTIPAKYKALSNGALVERKEVADGMVQYHYLLNQPHVTYLVSLVIGEFAVVTDQWRGIPVEYWVDPKNEKHAKRTFGRTPEMMEVFSKLLGTDYPWAKYAQSVVYNFQAGGMENTSTTTLIETTNIDERAAIDTESESLIAHELAHQWFGDLTTCRSWYHLWLNEGFATYMDAVWYEHGHSKTDYAYRMWGTMTSVAGGEDVNAKHGLVWPYYNNPNEPFGRGVSNPYSKGASVIHMLRRSLGDDLFWKCLAEFFKRHAYKSVESDDLRHVCDDLSGRSYEQFFHQWVYRPGAPHVKVSYEWSDEAKEARVTLEQTQPMSNEAPAFVADVAILTLDDNGSATKHKLTMNSRFSTLAAKCDKEPAQIVIDPEGALLAKWTNEMPVPMLIKQAQSGPSDTSRYHAIAQLADDDRDDVRDALKAVLTDEKQHFSFRVEAANALGKMQQDKARDILNEALTEGKMIREHKSRRAAIDVLGTYRDKLIVPTLIRFAKLDETYSCEVAATNALGKQDKTDEIVEVLLANTKKTANRDQIRTAAVNALTDLGEDKALAVAMEVATYGQPMRSRGSGISALGRLGKDMENKEDVRKFLLSLMRDSDDWSANNAIRALGELGDDKAIPELRKIADGSTDRLKNSARDAITAINKKSDETAAIRDLRERIDRLEKARETIEKKIATTKPS